MKIQRGLVLTRRKLIQLSSVIAVTTPFLWFSTRKTHAAIDLPEIRPARRPFGRVLSSSAIIRELPSIKSVEVRRLKFNNVVAILGQTISADSPTKYNQIWYQVEDGYLHSSLVQPCENTENRAETNVGNGFWGEVTVPLVAVRNAASAEARRIYPTYFGCVFRVLEHVNGPDSTAWYRISDGILSTLFVPAESMRRIQTSELSPLSPRVSLEHKRIDVDLVTQMATAYEYDEPVFSARVATGKSFFRADSTVVSYATTKGDFRIFEKRPSRRMIGGPASDSSSYDLPGIGWVSYFTRSRIAFHSTYWHNDFGSPRSHGCVNMLPEDALWVYRWTLPNAADETVKLTGQGETGSLVRVL